MKTKEYEIILHEQLEWLSLFFDTVDYRTPHFHSEWELIWILDRPLCVVCANERVVAEPGELVLFSPGQTHEFHHVNGSCTFLCLQLSPRLFSMDHALAMESLFPQRFLPPEDFARLKGCLREAAEAYFLRAPNYEPLCLGQICLAFYRLFSAMPSHRITLDEAASADRRNSRLSALIRFVDENYSHKILLSDFARREGCSMSYLSHFVKETLNQNFQQYVNAVRLNAACKLIATTDKKLLDVCFESGFSDYRYFSAAFKRQFGMTPQQYSRRQTRPEIAGTSLQHSIHSLERFYDDAQSRALLARLIPSGANKSNKNAELS